ncbi:4'-phosphopantetheinyl transferase family protein [Streptomyces sp. NPDC018610]|uniref:4'-phosphopantetheinyl transferase family protein n=1 Tax=Streptomyces sp. NPDC018610 TaxID=3365049 RepID=UPI0037AFFB9E
MSGPGDAAVTASAGAAGGRTGGPTSPLRIRDWPGAPVGPLPDPVDGPHVWLVRMSGRGTAPGRAARPGGGPGGSCAVGGDVPSPGVPWPAPGPGGGACVVPDVSVLGPEERRRAAALRRPEARLRYVAARFALRGLLGAYLGVPAGRVPLIRLPCPGCGRPHGRPALAGAAGAGLHFSLSRSGSLALLAVAHAPVGVDVERVPGPRLAADAAGALHPEDQAELAATAAPARPAAFARCWTRTEALVKATGEGLSGPSLGTVRLGAGAAPAPLAGWRLVDVEVPPGHAAACAVRDPRPPGA